MYPTIIKNNFFINPTEVTDLFNKVTMKKGGPNDHRKDLMKVLHYALLALYEHDRINRGK